MPTKFEATFAVVNELAEVSKEIERLLTSDRYDKTKFKSLTERITGLRQLLETFYYSGTFAPLSPEPVLNEGGSY
jgi:hypothetical protein